MLCCCCLLDFGEEMVAVDSSDCEKCTMPTDACRVIRNAHFPQLPTTAALNTHTHTHTHTLSLSLNNQTKPTGSEPAMVSGVLVRVLALLLSCTCLLVHGYGVMCAHAGQGLC